MIYTAYVPDEGKGVAFGGRYDDIGRAFGRARPATGFSADVKQLLESWYGGSFLAVEGGNDKKLYVMVQGNRRITISIKDDKDVMVRFTDLIISKKINQSRDS